MEQLFNVGLCLNDIPVHDSTKNLVAMSEHFSAEYELSHQLELMTNELQLRYRDVEIEKQKTEKYALLLNITNSNFILFVVF